MRLKVNSRLLGAIIFCALCVYLFLDIRQEESLLKYVHAYMPLFKSFLKALIFFCIILYLVRVLKVLFAKYILKRAHLNVSVRETFISVFGYIGVLVAAMVALGVMGVNFQNLAIIFGALSVGIGFGLQHVVNNFISGLLILIERPIKIGDWIVIKGQEGIVRKINIRSTELQTFNRASVIIPNADIISNDLVNWTHSDLYARVVIDLGVSYTTDIDKMKALLKSCMARDKRITKDPEPEIAFLNFGENSLNFQVRCVVKNAFERAAVQSDLNYCILKAFRQNEIEFPFPQRVVRILSEKSEKTL